MSEDFDTSETPILGDESKGRPPSSVSPAIESRRRNRGFLGRLWDRLPTPLKTLVVFGGIAGTVVAASALDAPPLQPSEASTDPTKTAQAELVTKGAGLKQEAAVMAQYTPAATATRASSYPTPEIPVTVKPISTLPRFK